MILNIWTSLLLNSDKRTVSLSFCVFASSVCLILVAAMTPFETEATGGHVLKGRVQREIEGELKPVSNVNVVAVYSQAPNGASWSDKTTAEGAFLIRPATSYEYRVTVNAVIDNENWTAVKIANGLPDTNEAFPILLVLQETPKTMIQPHNGPLLTAFLGLPLGRGPSSVIRLLTLPSQVAAQTAVCEQGDPGRVRGRVLDSQGVAIKGASVSAYERSSGRPIALDVPQSGKPTTSVTTDGDGCYSFAVPSEGEYTLQIDDVRFETAFMLFDVEKDASVSVYSAEKIERVIETKLASGKGAYSPQSGPGAAVSVTMSRASRSYTFIDRQLEALPLAGNRSFDDFVLLLSGVLPAPQKVGDLGPGLTPSVGSSGQYAINGLRTRQNNYTIDGSDNNQEDVGVRRAGFAALFPQATSSIKEFNIITLLADARYGRNIGGHIDALTKDARSAYHGELYGLFNDSRLAARNFFDLTAEGSAGSLPLKASPVGGSVLLNNQPVSVGNPSGGQDPYTRLQGGFLGGGPVPFSSTDTLFLASFERQQIRASRETHFSVPAVWERGVFNTGDSGFSRTKADDDLQLFPASLPGAAIFSLFPFPNNPLGPYGDRTYTEILPADGDAVLLAAKVDHYFSGGSILTGKYSLTDEETTLPTIGAAIFSTLQPRVRLQDLALTHHSGLGSSGGNIFRASASRTSSTFDPRGHSLLRRSDSFPGDEYLLNAPLLLNLTSPGDEVPRFVSADSPEGRRSLQGLNLGLDPIGSTESLTGPLGQVFIAGYSRVGIDPANFPQSRANNSFQIADTFTYYQERFDLAVGTDVRHIQINSRQDRGYRPLAAFHGLLSPGPGSTLPISVASEDQVALTGTSLAAAGVPTGLYQTLAQTPDSTVGLRFSHFNFFGQLDYKVTNRLKLNLGVRYQYNTAPSTVGSRLERAFDPNELKARAELVQQRCPVRCSSLVDDLDVVFPDGFAVTFGSDRNDIDPRFGFAWNPAWVPKTIVRGGLGLYSGQTPGVAINHSRNAYAEFIPLNTSNFSPIAADKTFLFNLANPLVRELTPGSSSIADGTINTLSPETDPVSILAVDLFRARSTVSQTFPSLDLTLPDRNLSNPFSLQWGLTIERNLFQDFFFSVAYVGTRGEKLFRRTTPAGGLDRSFIQFAKDIQPVIRTESASFPVFTGIMRTPQHRDRIANSFVLAPTIFESKGQSTFHSLQVDFRKRYSKGFQFDWALTYSHTIDDVSDFFATAGAFDLPQNSQSPSESGSSAFDVRVRSVANFIWDLPSADRSLFLRGWQIAGVLTAQTGQPYTVNSVIDINRDGNLTDRLDTTEGLQTDPTGPDRAVQLDLMDATAFLGLLARDGESGRIGRNTFRAPGIFSIDLSITKEFKVRLHLLAVRLSVFNLFNRTHFGIPERMLGAPGFGRAVNTLVPARNLRLTARYSF